MKNSPLFFLLLICLASPAHTEPRFSDLPGPVTKQWIKLLHYQKSLFGGYSGKIRNQSFYLNSTNGDTNPEAEFQTAFQTFSQAAMPQSQLTEEKNPFCRFPARAQWFRKYLPTETKHWPKAVCPKFDAYLMGLSGESISLVFSAYFLNNPSSAFGHSFLRINKSPGKDGQRFELLDYGINFAANVDTNNPIVYAFKGLMGGFSGSFTSIPYYFKVREYNNAESRDLWEYELNVDRDFVDLFIGHLWEVGPTDIKYYYLSENCSYWVLAIVDAVDPRFDIMDRINNFVIPSDTIRTAWETPGLVKTFKFRPSVHTEMVYRLKDMTNEEKREMLEIVKTKKIEFSGFSEEQKRKTLDAALDFYEYRNPTEIQIQSSPEAQFKNQLLSSRSQVNLVSPPLNITPSELDKPHLSHPSRRISLGAIGSNQNGNFFHFQYRFSLHDQLDPIQGYPEYAEIIFGDFDFTYSQKSGKTELERFTLFEVLANTEFSQIEPHISWRVRVGADRLRITDFLGCHGGTFELGGGLTTGIGFGETVLLYAGAKGVTHYLPSCENRFILGAGPNARIRFKFHPRWMGLAEGYWRFDNQETKSYREVSIGTQWSANQIWGIRGQLIEKNREQNAQLDWVYYF